MAKPSIDVRSVSADEYRESIQLAQKYSVSINNTFALIVMEQQGIDESYTFDRHFERTAVRCVQE
jgi:predicted nucleic acid-binding protein